MNTPPPLHSTTPPRKRLSGCAIAAIAGGVLVAVGIPLLGILAAIALPAYQQYVTRTKIQLGYQQAFKVAMQIEEFRQNHQACPAPGDIALPGNGIVPLGGGNAHAQAALTLGSEGADACVVTIQFTGVGPLADNRTLTLVSHAAGEWDCTGGDLPATLRPMQCRSAHGTTP